MAAVSLSPMRALCAPRSMNCMSLPETLSFYAPLVSELPHMRKRGGVAPAARHLRSDHRNAGKFACGP
jgi:hypothetical protein